MITIENQKYFNLSAIETACNIPRGVLLSSIKGLRKLPTKHADKLNEFLTGLIACDKIEPKEIKEVIKPIIKPLPRVKQSDINNYQLLFSGNYKHKQTGDIITKDQYLLLSK